MTTTIDAAPENSFPITLHACAGVFNQPQLQDCIANIEAWLNFQALSKGWYGDESKVLTLAINIHLDDDFAAKVSQCKSELESRLWMVDLPMAFACHQDGKPLNVSGDIAFSRQQLAQACTSKASFEAALKQQLALVVEPVAKASGLL